MRIAYAGGVAIFDKGVDAELQIEKSSESPNDRVRFRFDLRIRFILEPPD